MQQAAHALQGLCVDLDALEEVEARKFVVAIVSDKSTPNGVGRQRVSKFV